MRKVVNSIISQVDAITMSLISSAITQTIAAGTAWTAASPTILRNILLAKGVVAKLNLGYNPDMLVVNDDQYAYLLTDASLTNMWRRETEANPVTTGDLGQRIGGLRIVVSPALASGTAYVLDSTQLGAMADEVDGAPGYATSDQGVQIKAIRNEKSDSWDLQGRRKTVPVVQEPGAGIKITGIGA
jgi:hypothetical protein